MYCYSLQEENRLILIETVRYCNKKLHMLDVVKRICKAITATIICSGFILIQYVLSKYIGYHNITYN